MFMEIGAIGRLFAARKAEKMNNVQKNNESHQDRDPSQGGREYNRRKKITQLTPEQEDEAVKKLNALTAFSSSGLSAEIVRQEGHATFVAVKAPGGKIIRQLPYEQLIDIYIDSDNGEMPTGLLFRKAA